MQLNTIKDDIKGGELPPIPAKRYFTIGEVSDLCGVRPHVLRYWEQEFTQLRPMKRRGNRRYYQHHEVLLVRKIRSLLYEHGFTISGARNRLEGGTATPQIQEMANKKPEQPVNHQIDTMSIQNITKALKEIADLLR